MRSRFSLVAAARVGFGIIIAALQFACAAQAMAQTDRAEPSRAAATIVLRANGEAFRPLEIAIMGRLTERRMTSHRQTKPLPPDYARAPTAIEFLGEDVRAVTIDNILDPDEYLIAIYAGPSRAAAHALADSLYELILTMREVTVVAFRKN